MSKSLPDERTMGRLSKPFAVIDFEASSLDENSFPIEVGVAILRIDSIESWSSLIRPTRDWMRRDAWSARSERVHGISRQELEDAPLPEGVLATLNVCLHGLAVYCDGGDYDARWLSELVDAAGAPAMFGLVDIGAALPDPLVLQKFQDARSAMPRAHRAAADAMQIASAIRSVRQEVEG